MRHKFLHSRKKNSLLSTIFITLGALLLSATPTFMTTAFATNCSAITGGSITDNGDGNWLLQWDALPDTSNIDYLIIFATSGGDWQSWYNNGDGYTWTPHPYVSPSATSRTISKSSVVSFADSNSIQSITFSIRKDNNTNQCYPVTTLGTINLLAAPAFTLSESSKTTNAGSAIAGYTINSTGGAIANYSISPAIGNGLSFSTITGLISGTPTSQASAVTYTITATNATSTATATYSLTVNPDPAIAAAAEAAKKAKEQKELTELLSIVPSIAGLALNIGNLTNSLLTTKCVKGQKIKYVKKGAKCPKGYVKKK